MVHVYTDLIFHFCKAGVQILVCLDSRLRGNDMGVEFSQTYKGYIFVAIDEPLGYMVLPPFYKIGEIHKCLS